MWKIKLTQQKVPHKYGTVQKQSLEKIVSTWLLSTKDLKLRGMTRHIDIVIDQ